MVIRIVKNTTPSPIVLGDLSGVIVPASGQIDLGLSFDTGQIGVSEDLANQLCSGNLVLNVGDEDILFPRSYDIIRGVSQFFRTTADAKLIVNSTPQPGVTTDFCLTSRTDSGANSGGDYLHIDHTVFQFGQETPGADKPCGIFMDNGQGQECSQYWLNTKYMEFTVLGNRTFFYDGGIMWRGLADNGTNGLLAISLTAVNSVFDPSAFEVTPGEGNAVIVDGYLMVPVPGLVGGTHLLPLGQTFDQTPQPFHFTATSPMVMTGTYWSPAFWSIDYDIVEQKFFNLLPVEDPYAEHRSTYTGNSNIIRIFGNILTTEIPLASFVKDFLVVGNSSNFFGVASPDATEIGYGIKIRLDCKTIVKAPHTNVPWTLVGYMKTYREHTI